MKAIAFTVSSLALMLASSTVNAAPQKRHAASRPPSASSSREMQHAIPETGILNAADLISIAKIASRAVNDKYSDDASVKYAGREFVIYIPANDFVSDFDKDSHKLTIYDLFGEWELGKKINIENYNGQNGFGARVVVSKKRGNIWGVQVPSAIFDHKILLTQQF